ncbi:MAG: phospholipase D-like domain-containing protein [Candidatus Methanomethylophilus sp.]|nr:phospholipase D-like domain-containing protein [Methanomethylophilus sp.]
MRARTGLWRYRILPTMAAVLLILIAPPLISGTAEGDAAAGLLITEVSPFSQYEGISITNGSDSAVSLNGLTLTDGEGTLTFTAPLSLASDERLTLVKNAGGDWFSSRDGTMLFAAEGIEKKGSFILADAGDDVALYRGDVLLDTVCYRSGSVATGWSGAPVALGSGQYLVRTGQTDTDTAADWLATKPGWTRLVYGGPGAYEAAVTPFAFPESAGIPIYRTLEEARASVDISLYLLTCPNIATLLCDLAGRGVAVRVLLEGAPLGMDISTELRLMRSLTDAGGEVRLINPPTAETSRFTYLHTKYAVIDGSAVVITSENWTSSNLGYGTGNRGWGAVITGSEYATVMAAIFANDWSTEFGDVQPLDRVYPGLQAYGGTLSYTPPAEYETVTFTAGVTPIVSPDCSWDALETLTAGTGTRLYAEQLDLGSSYADLPAGTPVAWLQAAAQRGADVRLILDSGGDERAALVNLINTTTAVKAIALDGGNDFAAVHNKGIIADGNVWVGSVNWTATSFHANREAAVLITAPTAAEFWQELFLKDWGVNIHTVEEDGLQLTVGRSGDTVVLRAVGPADTDYEWSFGDGRIRTTAYPAVAFTVSGPGEYTATVRLVGTDLTAAVGYTVEAGTPSWRNWLPYAVSAALTGLGALVGFRRESNLNSRGR